MLQIMCLNTHFFLLDMEIEFLFFNWLDIEIVEYLTLDKIP